MSVTGLSLLGLKLLGPAHDAGRAPRVGRDVDVTVECTSDATVRLVQPDLGTSTLRKRHARFSSAKLREDCPSRSGERRLIVVLPQHIDLPGRPFEMDRVRTELLLPNERAAPSLIRSVPWMWHRFPVPVSLRSSASHPLLGAQVEAAVTEINRASGARVFALSPEGSATASVVIDVQDGTGSVLGRATRNVPRCEVGPSRVYCVPQWAEDVRIQLHPNAGVPEVQHELLHALGLEHTCVVPSVMATEFTQDELTRCGRARYDAGLHELRLRRALGPFDVAAVLLLIRLAESLDGWRGTDLVWRVFH